MVSAAFYSKSDDLKPFLSTPAPALASLGVALMGLAVASSVYAFVPAVRNLLASPIVQQVHLLLQITHFGTRAPPALTLTDGGLTECIGIVELLRRRTRWIVVVDTTEDPTISLLYLRDSFDVAKRDGLFVGDILDAGSPLADAKDGDPLPDPVPYDDLLSPVIQGRKYARLKLTYPAQQQQQQQDTPAAAAFADVADVFVIKMRKAPPPDPRACERLIAPKELVPDGVDPDKLPAPLLDVEVEPLKLNQNEINGLCCECCHTTCSCLPCGELPFLSVGNQFLTPFQFANLSRLARELSDAPLTDLIKARDAS